MSCTHQHIKEIESAKEILTANEDALKNASGVTSLNGKMIDKPMVTRAMVHPVIC